MNPESTTHLERRMKRWGKPIRIAIPVLLLVAAWMSCDGHRTVALVLLLASIAGQLTLATYDVE